MDARRHRLQNPVALCRVWPEQERGHEVCFEAAFFVSRTMKYSSLARSALIRVASPLVLALIAGCAAMPRVTTAQTAGATQQQEPAPTTPPPGVSPAASAATAKGPVAPTALRPFADVVKDAKRIDGLFTLWQKEDKVWLELAPGDLNKP